MAGKTLALTGLQSAEIAIAPEARELRDKLLVEIRGVTAVYDAFDADVAADVMRRATQLSRGIEADRTTVKAPVLALGKKIDALAKEMKLGVIDMHAALADKPQMLPDRVHPNTEGAGEMAKAAAAVLSGKTAVPAARP